MKLITYHRHEGRVRTGVVLNQQVLDISDWIETLPLSAQALAHHQRAGTLPPVGGMLRWLSAGPDALAKLQDHVAWGAITPTTPKRLGWRRLKSRASFSKCLRRWWPLGHLWCVQRA